MTTNETLFFCIRIRYNAFVKRLKVITDFGRLALPLLDMILRLDFCDLSFALSRARMHLVCI